MMPAVHLNGTSRGELVRGYEEALRVVASATDALCSTAPNGRDYYVYGLDALAVAQREHAARVVRLVSVADELEMLWTALTYETAPDSGGRLTR